MTSQPNKRGRARWPIIATGLVGPTLMTIPVGVFAKGETIAHAGLHLASSAAVLVAAIAVSILWHTPRRDHDFLARTALVWALSLLAAAQLAESVGALAWEGDGETVRSSSLEVLHTLASVTGGGALILVLVSAIAAVAVLLGHRSRSTRPATPADGNRARGRRPGGQQDRNEAAADIEDSLSDEDGTRGASRTTPLSGRSRSVAASALVAGALAVLGAVGVSPASARTATATFNVSFYGVQRYSTSTTSRENPSSSCFDVQQRGTEHGLTVARFESRKPTRLTIRSAPYGLPDFSYRAAGADTLFPLPARATWRTNGSTDYDVSSCVAGSRQWHAAPPPEHACGAAAVPGTGGSLQPQSATTLLFAGGQSIPRLTDPLAGCAYGEHQYGLYQARGHYSAADLLDPRFGKHIVVLRAHSRNVTPFNGKGGIGSQTVETRTTVYVTFVRVR